MQDFSKTGQVVMDLTESADEQASMGNVGGQATKPQGATGGSKASTQISDAELSACLLMFKCLDSMSKDQNILEDIENAYIAAVMKALAKWQESGTNALQAMHTASTKEWDKLHSELIQATVEFRNACMGGRNS